jgi:uncharacterized repeat protein (TIGR01451 family)
LKQLLLSLLLVGLAFVSALPQAVPLYSPPYARPRSLDASDLSGSSLGGKVGDTSATRHASSHIATGASPSATAGTKSLTQDATDNYAATPHANLKVTVNDGRATAAAGAKVTYTIIITNLGPSNVSSAMVDDRFPDSFTAVSYTATQSDGASGFTVTGMGDIHDVVALPAGSQITYKAKGTISGSATGTLSDTATVTPPNNVIDPKLANNRATDTDTLLTMPQITSQPVSETVASGQTATFSVRVTGALPLGYEWRRNGVTITDATFSSYTTPALSQADDGAIFSVITSNVAVALKAIMPP